ncbi:Glutamyl-tRNA(Gln) amidotransferase subunit B [Podosphaera aphanis]|nr:Glutamyl-tRNA(Gln) amidotransferase subunit B [Podosphaera aphanis]
MARISTAILHRYVLHGHLPSRGCLRLAYRTTRLVKSRDFSTAVFLETEQEPQLDTTVSIRKQLKDSQKEKKRTESEVPKKLKEDDQEVAGWELTVGIEIHALLNTERKLFSSAASTITAKPNTHVTPFDAAIPGTHPIFQKETLIPAIRAALALNCSIQRVSKFDRKHYFHWDQPAGYQITQFYEPFAKDGYLTLFAHDGIAKEDGDQIQVGIRQIQMEQDTAKTISKPGGYLLDLNRVGLPLIEIITQPVIHHPRTAAAFVRKVQKLLLTVDACVVGMEFGGLRADVNVSVRRCEEKATLENNDNKLLGQRVEIKNLSSFKSIEDAIIAERNRQISVLEKGDSIIAETRGWTIGTTRTIRLRGKEGEVDYRYMPDPDIPPVVIGNDIISHLKGTLGILPDDEINLLVERYGLTIKDALTLVSVDNGERAELFYKLTDLVQAQLTDYSMQKIGKLCGNWILHDLASLRHDQADEDNPLGVDLDGNCLIPAEELATLIYLSETRKIQRKTAKWVLKELYNCLIEKRPQKALAMIEKEGLWCNWMSEDQYRELVEGVLNQHEILLKAILSGNTGKIKALLGMILKGDTKGIVDPLFAERVLVKAIEERQASK